MTQPWQCPRCGRINAPFNPTCFCRPDEYNDNSQEKSPAELSPHIMDAERYLNPGDLYKIFEGEKRKADIINGMIPNFYSPKTEYKCSICNGFHNHGLACAMLKNNLPKGGQFI